VTPVAYALSLGLGAVATAFALVVTPHLFTGERYRRTNYRGRMLFAPGGLALAKPLAVGWLISGLTDGFSRAPLVMLAAGSAMGFLGFLDDVFGDRHAGGLFGHARALVRGRLTTGMVKAAGGVVVGLASAYALSYRGIWLLAAGAVVALAANLANLLDLRPARAVKVWSASAVALSIAGVGDGGAITLLTVLAGAAVFAVVELREDVMLGDTGANLLGAVLGTAAIASLGEMGVVVSLAVLAVATLASEVVSFTRVIEATPPLRWLDELGRKRVSGAE
jgi:UDP-GlcNAc:undecaprenyl-phosphate/decaprenyl-phosphate GlcNAc-1-phosphate transferase